MAEDHSLEIGTISRPRRDADSGGDIGLLLAALGWIMVAAVVAGLLLLLFSDGIPALLWFGGGLSPLWVPALLAGKLFISLGRELLAGVVRFRAVKALLMTALAGACLAPALLFPEWLDFDTGSAIFGFRVLLALLGMLFVGVAVAVTRARRSPESAGQLLRALVVVGLVLVLGATAIVMLTPRVGVSPGRDDGRITVEIPEGP
jgi:hypothetical protein